MPVISEYDRKKIATMYEKNPNVSSISRELDIPYQQVYALTKLRERGYASMAAYQKERKQINGPNNSIEHRIFSAYLKGFLGGMIKNQSWLAKELGSTRYAVSLYVNGKTLPKKYEKDLLKILPTRRRSIESLIEELMSVKRK